MFAAFPILTKAVILCMHAVPCISNPAFERITVSCAHIGKKRFFKPS